MGQARAAAAGDGKPETPARVTPEIAAEAAVWVTRLHGPQRSRQMERECLAWQQRSAAHREAFERCSDTWQSVPRVSLASAFAASGAAAAPAAGASWPNGATWRIGLAVSVLAVLGGVFGLLRWMDHGVYVTEVGEQRLVVLDDGTRMSLNTDTQVRVDLDSARRTVLVRGGEVLFEVAKDTRRPFAVQAGGSEVLALGTTFAVRLTPQAGKQGAVLAVSLIEGRVAVRAGGSGDGPAPRAAVTLQAGDRLRLVAPAGGTAGPAEPHIDRPQADQVVAWKRSEVVFDDASLGDALAEMNRYSRTPIVLHGDPGLAGLRISGLYRTGDAVGFAHAVAALHGLKVQLRDGRLELAKPQ